MNKDQKLVENHLRIAPEGGVQGIQNVPRSAWIKTDTESKTANATSVETHLLAASVLTHTLRDTFCTPCTSGLCPPLFSPKPMSRRNIMNAPMVEQMNLGCRLQERCNYPFDLSEYSPSPNQTNPPQS
jgi:hypothetical protein